ncbi:hypothetical protein NQZ68_025951 [Dissostichus eleginoides]|nr:hypothetical protein NQZ68_025951 [Dissostichus eleginoides]
MTAVTLFSIQKRTCRDSGMAVYDYNGLFQTDSSLKPDMEQQLRSASSVDELMSLIYPSYWTALKCRSKLSAASSASRVSPRAQSPLRPPAEEPTFAAAYLNLDVLKSIESEWRKTQCMPREVCVDVGREFGAPTNIFYKPPCVSVYRCGGCCHSEDKQCRNISTGYLSKTGSKCFSKERSVVGFVILRFHLADLLWQCLEHLAMGLKRKEENIGLLALLCLLLSGDIHPCPGPGVVSIDLTAGGPAAELHTPSAGFRRGWLAEQLGPPAGLCGLALTAADLAAGRLPTPSEDCGSAQRASGLAAEILAPPADFRRGRLAKQLALRQDLLARFHYSAEPGLARASGLAPAAAGLASGPTSTPSEDCGTAPMASSLAAETHKTPASFDCSTVNNGTELFEITVPITQGTKPVTISVANHTQCSCLSKLDVYKQVHSIIRRALPE